MQSNLSIVDRYMRLAGGLMILGMSASQKRGKTLMLSLGAMKVAEGVTGWCPLKYASQTLEKNGQSGQKAQKDQKAPSQRHAHSAEQEKHNNDGYTPKHDAADNEIPRNAEEMYLNSN